MKRVRLRGLISMAAGAAMIAPAFTYLWFVDYRGVQMATWATGLIVAWSAPAMGLLFMGLVAMLTGKVLRPVSLKLSLDRRPRDLVSED